MLPDDSNPAGNVHGGEIMRLIEQAGIISCSRHMCQGSKPNTIVALARLDKVSFKNPVMIGDVAEVVSHVSAVSTYSMEVTARVTSERMDKKTLTNTARLWYVAIKEEESRGFYPDQDSTYPPKLQVAKDFCMPGLNYESKQHELDAAARYHAQRKARQMGSPEFELESFSRHPNSLPVLSHIVLPSECYRTGTIFGGVLLKLIDSAAAIPAIRHCSTNIVTASLEALNIKAPVYLGNLVSVYAQPVFTSSRSLEIAAYVQAEDLFSGHSWHAVSAHLTFVSLDDAGKTMPIPPLIPKTHEARIDFEKGAERYKLRKLAREAGDD